MLITYEDLIRQTLLEFNEQELMDILKDCKDFVVTGTSFSEAVVEHIK